MTALLLQNLIRSLGFLFRLDETAIAVLGFDSETTLHLSGTVNRLLRHLVSAGRVTRQVVRCFLIVHCKLYGVQFFVLLQIRLC